MDTRTAAVETKQLTKKYDKQIAVDKFEFRVEQREIFGLLGPNGSGKTTTINLICGLISPTDGTISVMGHDVSRHANEVRRLLGTVPQETALYEELTALQNMEFHADLYGVRRGDRDEKIKNLLELVGLWERRSDAVSHYSGGMKRRLAMSRALLHDPKFIIVDEPTLGVDVQSRNAIWNHIKELPKQGRTVLLATNYLEEASRLCDRIGIIDHGRLVVQGSPGELEHRYGHTIIEIGTQLPLGELVLKELRELRGVRNLEIKEPTQIVLSLEGEGLPALLVTRISRETQILRLVVREPTLDEAFLQLTGKELRD